MSRKAKSRNLIVLVVIAALMVTAIIVATAIINQGGKSKSQISREAAMTQLDKKLKKIEVTNVDPRKAAVQISNDLSAELPDIEKYPLSVAGTGQLDIEIFSSTEKSSSGTDGWLNEVAKKYNSEHHEIDGKWATISVRPIASGAAVDYMVSGKYVPDVYSPSNTLFGDMIAAENVDIHLECDRIAGNTAGILLSKNTFNKLKESYGDVNISSVIEATIKSEISMGYTNPYASSTGINFLISALKEFDSNDILSSASSEKFQKFQQNVPFVAYTTLQMREAADSGVLDAFVMEYQGYYNVAELRDYEFIPFGVRHDSPVYSLGSLNADKKELLQDFISYCKNDENQQLAKRYGFNYHEEYQSMDVSNISGANILSAQHLWKTEKDTGSPVMAIFIADISGSMAGAPINNLKTSLINASQYINTTNYVGLISYDNNVYVNLPIRKFDLNQRSYFTGAVEDLAPNGSTATYDAVLVGLKELMKAKEQVEKDTGEKIKPMLFVLSDGETNVGNDLGDIRKIVGGLEVPCYTIGYNANLKALSELSAINEAASINADSDDVVYNLKSLFNAQM